MQPPPPPPEGNGTRPISPDRRPTPACPAPRVRRRGVSRLDRVTLQLGVAVAVVIALCSYAVSATSLYALGVQAGYSWWQAAAVPVVADGPAIYGMFRIISRSRRNAKGAGYGWLLVGCGTLASIGGNVAHAQDDLVAQAIAAAIPLAVLAMLEGLKGDAGEVTRLTARPPTKTARARWASPSAPAGHHRPTPRPHRQPDPAAAASAPSGGVPAGPGPADPSTVGARLQAAYAQPRPDGQAWTARTLAEAAGCGRSSAASFLQRQRPPTGGPHVSRPRWQLRDAALGYASRGIPVLPLHYPLPHRSDLQPPPAATSARRRGERLLVSGSGLRPARQASPWQPGPPRRQGRHHQPGPGPGLVDPPPPGQHRPGHRPAV